MKRAALFTAFLMLSACGSIPQDQEQTLDRIRESGEVRVGMVATGQPSPHVQRLRTLVARSAARAGGRVRMSEDTTEPLLLQLEAGELDLVVGEFDTLSPWYHRVHLLPPMVVHDHAEGRVETTAAARNGENAWIMLLEREARALSDRQ